MALLINDVRVKHPDWSSDFCRRGVDQLVGFLAACGVASEPLAPSAAVDEFWHCFILRTVPYAEFCDLIAGRFIHHIPEDERPHDPRLPRVANGNATRARTIEAILTAGYDVDPEFWPELSANCNSKCTQCYQGCHDSPK
ncbi:hypothetical protein [Catellatospora sp. IY07-71]|uniref:glycine-rich domain-containing protein n=1 Tax=Catellatospora sp. IY07-71 TaxID=2728827 RepID=UPI001BB3A2F0|nr:hypothetical protein [Catellatospora sp. IY07-71]